MRRIALALAAVMLVAFAVTACGKEAQPTNTAASFTCPSENARSFETVRFAANMGLAAGTFHHWIYKPWKANKFEKGTDGRTAALLKAGITAAADSKLLQNAVEDVKGSTKLCPVIGQPLAKLSDYFSNLRSAITHGDFGKLGVIEGVLGSVTGLMGHNGAPVTERTGS